MKKRNQKIIKFLAVLTIALVLSLTINTAIIFSGTNKEEENTSSDIQTVQAAEQTGCCIETKTGRTCVNDTTADQCLPNKFRTYAGNIKDCSIVAPQDCSPQTCIPKELSEPCLRSKTAAECIALDGTPVPDALESIPACIKGCCIINKGEVADVMQNRTCQYQLNLTGYDETMMQFLPDVVNQEKCKELGASTDTVCCVLGGGSCKYGFRSQCTELNGRAVPLQGGEYCRDVRDCAVTEHSKKSCGTRPGTEFDIYWFDSQGNQEELVQGCNYQEQFCRINQMTRQPECVNASCYFPLSMTHQNMTTNAPKVESIKLFTYTLLSGTSQCYNFYTDYGDDSMYGKSTGLQNEILHCAMGKVEIQGLGTDRSSLCVNGFGNSNLPLNNETGPGINIPNPYYSSPAVGSATIHGIENNNTWQDCKSCGITSGIGPLISGLFAPIPPFGWAISKYGGICTPQNCEKMGDCVFHRKIPGWGFLAAPIGSCDPKYPPGTNSPSAQATVNSSCKCGGTAMSGGIWNVCNQKECKSQGDCTFTPYNGWQATGEFFIAFMAGTLLSRFTWIPVECLLATTLTAIFPAGGVENFGTCFVNAYKEYGEAPVKAVGWIVKGTDGVKGAIGAITGILGLFGISQLIK